ncbi:alpha/beta hydrolase [Streptomyces indicus]|uniref:TAP-like protein n=1 Tax=Streptomyces indicus TaxID=417292 RepID=A0A1G9FV48_9ACTN|nr:alpha/beta hydrolase [Streptomyces indicus]SDK92215.1 TAP-like protein [Streptomyces indicus]
MASTSGDRAAARTGIARPAALAAAALLAGSLLAGCSGDGAASGKGGGSQAAGSTTAPAKSPGAADDSGLPAALTGQKLNWGDCEGGGSGASDSSWKCATLKVPLDYEDPDGKTIGVALIRSEARDDSKRIGSLLFNFGGPGGSGVNSLPAAAPGYPALHERYDLVGFDPRGVERSGGVECREDADTEKAFTTIDLTPDTAAEEKAYFADAAAFGAGCKEKSGEILPYVTTSNTARDMDLMRIVLGDDKLHYLGYSYGTELGGTYAHLFPEKVGRLVLDAVVDPSADMIGHAKNQTRGFQRALENYLKAEGRDPKEGTQEIAALLKSLDKKPLPAAGGRDLNETLGTTGITQALYSESMWPQLTAALQAAEDGDGSPLLALADEYNNRDASGRYGRAMHAQRSISCADSQVRPTPAQAKKLLPEFMEISPVFGGYLGWDAAGWCHKWPVAGEHKTPEVSAPGAAPILVIGTTGDSATPFEGARRMADELGKGVGVHLTFKGEGHGAYGGGNPCVDSTVEDYLLDHKVPEDGKVCS